MSHGIPSESNTGHSGPRPTLPSIRHLFGEELAQPPNANFSMADSPSGAFARLRVRDDSLPARRDRPHTRPPLLGPASQVDGSSSRSTSADINLTPFLQPAFSGLPQAPSSSSPSQRAFMPYASRSPPSRPPSRSVADRHVKSRSSDDSHNSVGSTSHTTLSSLPNRRSFEDPSHPAAPVTRDAHYRSGDSLQGHSDVTASPPVLAYTHDAPRPSYMQDERVYVGRYVYPDMTTPAAASRADASAREPALSPPPRYECSYCGKAFNRPSSLKIHLNSHTGEKPFACPSEGCGRSFSVLSNMRRHARAHSSAPSDPEEPSGEEGDDE